VHRGRRIFGCLGVALAVVAVVVFAVPFTRELAVGVIRGEPVGEDFRPLGHHTAKLSDPDPAVQSAGVNGISKFGKRAGPAVPDLVALIRGIPPGEKSSGRGKLRVHAVITLSLIGPAATEAVPLLTELLDDPDWDVRLWAAQALAAVGPGAKPAVPTLTEKVATSFGADSKEFTRTLRSLDPEAAKEAVGRALDHAKPSVRSSALERVAEWGPGAKDLAPKVRDRLKDPDENVRWAAKDALERIEPPPPAP
jgi:HEAT repeat protein